MIKKKILIALFIISCYCSFSQNQTNFWQFGLWGALDFNSGTPVVLTNSILNTAEGSASISDAAGNLLFYTDGVSVWDNTHTVMTNGTGLHGDVSTSQSAVIIPDPGNANLYYIFTIDDEGGSLEYSVVDITLRSGKGDVTTKNSHLSNSMTEKLSAVYHCNGHDIWIMAHDIGNNAFTAYLVTNAGVAASPITSNTGPVHLDVHGYMKFNTLGTKIVCSRDTIINGTFSTYQGNGYVDLFSFDNFTGAVSNPLTLALTNHQKTYGVEFSPDNSKLYVSYYDITGLNGGNSAVGQFDLNSGNIQASFVELGTSTDPNILRAIQLGPDQKIYISKSGTPFLCVINNPNLAGAASNYTDNAINVDPGGIGASCALGLPNFLQSYLDPGFPLAPSCNTSTVVIPPPTPQIDTCGTLFVPTGFSPNNDGQNDIECVMGNCILDLQFSIYDRWGEKVFETTDHRQCWDGIYRGKLMNTGIYVYYLKATLQNGEKVEKKGNINLIR